MKNSSITPKDGDPSTFAAFFYAATVATTNRTERQMFTLLDCWRELLCQTPFSLRPQLLVETERLRAQLLPYDLPSLTAIVSCLAQLARFDTRTNFLRHLEAPGRYPPGSSIEKHKVSRHQQEQSVRVDSLVIHAPGALADQEAAVSLLQEWIEAEDINYYRITTTGHNDPSGKTRLIRIDEIRHLRNALAHTGHDSDDDGNLQTFINRLCLTHAWIKDSEQWQKEHALALQL